MFVIVLVGKVKSASSKHFGLCIVLISSNIQLNTYLLYLDYLTGYRLFAATRTPTDGLRAMRTLLASTTNIPP